MALKLSTKVIILVSFTLFILRLTLCHKIYPGIFTDDFYEYIELGNNIFSKLNFNVLWEMDCPITYPPIFPVLIHMVTFFTKNPLISIQYINIFSASFYIIPLFLLTRNLLNNLSAVFAVIFATFYFGILEPCKILFVDYFFALLAMSICCLLRELLINKTRQEIWFFALGLLIGLAYLTKYSGILYCFIACGYIFYFIKRNVHDPRSGFKMVLSLLSGFLLLFISYHILLSRTVDEKPLGIDHYAFYDGNYQLEGKSKYILNPQGNEFDLLSAYKQENPLTFCLSHPVFICKKEIKGLKMISNDLAGSIFPFIPRSKVNAPYAAIHYLLIIFIIIMAVFFRKNDAGKLSVCLFTAIIVLIPLYLFSHRYLMPYTPMYFMLCLFFIDALYNFINIKMKSNIKYGLMALIMIGCVSLASIYILKCCTGVFSTIKNSHKPFHIIQAATWLKDKSEKTHTRNKIMANSTAFAYLTGSSFVMIPKEENWGKVVRFAVLKNINYILLDKHDVKIYSSQINPKDPLIQGIYSYRSKNDNLAIYKISL